MSFILTKSNTHLDLDMTCTGEYALIGGDEESFGWDIAQLEVLSGGPVVKNYPNQSLKGFTVPDVVVVVADLESRPATLSFRSGDKDYGNAVMGLEHVHDLLFPAISTTGPTASIRIKYLGGSGSNCKYRT